MFWAVSLLTYNLITLCPIIQDSYNHFESRNPPIKCLVPQQAKNEFTPQDIKSCTIYIFLNEIEFCTGMM